MLTVELEKWFSLLVSPFFVLNYCLSLFLVLCRNKRGEKTAQLELNKSS